MPLKWHPRAHIITITTYYAHKAGQTLKCPLRTCRRGGGRYMQDNPQNIIWHKAKAQKVAFLWLVIHKVMLVDEWHGKISMKIDKSCPCCGM